MKRNVDSYQYQCLNDAKTILTEIGMPSHLYNPRCVMTLAAMAEITDTKPWKSASEHYHSIDEIIKYINANFPNKAGLDKSGYQPNTRESIRDETIKPFADAGLVEIKFGLAKNDRNNAHRLTAQFAALVRTYGSDKWKDALAGYLETHQRYTEALEQAKKADTGYSVEYQGIKLQLDRSEHNKLQIQILDFFAPRFTHNGKLLYIGDTSNKNLYQDEDTMRELGISIPSESRTYPDIIIFDHVDRRIVFVEAYSSTGEFTLTRVKEISNSCRCSNDIEVAFVTAFSTTKRMKSKLDSIAWDTDIWIAEHPTHLIHKNGNHFLGHKLQDFS